MRYVTAQYEIGMHSTRRTGGIANDLSLTPCFRVVIQDQSGQIRSTRETSGARRRPRLASPRPCG
jgi:hypothetical protein